MSQFSSPKLNQAQSITQNGITKIKQQSLRYQLMNHSFLTKDSRKNSQSKKIDNPFADNFMNYKHMNVHKSIIRQQNNVCNHE